MARRGFFAEIQHQSRLAARTRARTQRESESRYNAALRRAEQFRKAEEKAAKELARATEAERKRLTQLAHEAHVDAMDAEVERRNLELNEIHEEIDSLLLATLNVDDYVDLNTLRVVVAHPPFGRPDLEIPTPPPGTFLDPPPRSSPSELASMRRIPVTTSSCSTTSECSKRSESIATTTRSRTRSPTRLV